MSLKRVLENLIGLEIKRMKMLKTEIKLLRPVKIKKRERLTSI
jgi:hypothetical protein